MGEGGDWTSFKLRNQIILRCMSPSEPVSWSGLGVLAAMHARCTAADTAAVAADKLAEEPLELLWRPFVTERPYLDHVFVRPFAKPL